MRKTFWLLLGVVLFCTSLANAQRIKKYEYWIDDGFDQRVQQTIAPLTTFFNSLQIDFSGVEIGLHTLHIRYQDTNNEWGCMLSKPVYKLPFTEYVKINGYEYWVDDAVDDRFFQLINPVNPLDKDIVLDLSKYDDGLHLLQIRFRDNFDNWGAVIWRFFLKQTSSKAPPLVTAYRYWVDEDLASMVTVNLKTPVVSTEVNAQLQMTNLERGMHHFYMQFLDTNDEWSSAIGTRFEMKSCHPQKPVLPYGSETVCMGEVVDYFWTNGATGATSYEWTVEPVDANAAFEVGVVSGTGNKATMNWNTDFFGDVNVFVQGKNICGLGESSDTLRVAVIPVPGQPAPPIGDTKYCINAPNSLFKAPFVQYAESYSWFLTPTNAGVLIPSSDNTSELVVDWKLDFVGDARLTVSGKNQCGVAEQSMPLEVSVNELPEQPSITAEGPTEFCIGGSVLLSASPVADYNFLWSNDSTEQAVEVTEGGDYTVVIIDKNGCVSKPSTALFVNVYNLPVMPVILQDGLELRSSLRWGNQWYSEKQLIEGATERSFLPPSYGTYRVQITDDQGCQNMSKPFLYRGLGVTNLELGGLLLYPNPNRGEFVVELKKSVIDVPIVEVFDKLGRSVPFSLNYSSRKFSVKLLNPASGQYYIQVQIKGERVSLPFIVEQ